MLIPDLLKEETSTLLKVFQELSEKHGVHVDEGEQIFNLLPAEIQSAPVFKDRLTKLWRYEYGCVWTNFKNTGDITGTHVACSADRLFKSLLKFNRLCGSQAVKAFASNKLKIIEKHLDFLAELDPIVRPVCEFKAEYEPDDGKIEWRFLFNNNASCLLEVKYRITGLLAMFQELAVGRGNDRPPYPHGFFRNTEHKFSSPTNGCHQGLWIVCEHYVDPAELQTEFDKLDQTRIQFAVIATPEEQPAQIVAVSNEIKNWLKDTFNLTDRTEPPPLQL